MQIFEAVAPIRFRGNDVILFHVLDPAEIDFTFTDPSSFEDLESGEQMPVVPDALAEQYRALVKAHIDELQTRATAQRIDYMLLKTSMPLDHALFQYLSHPRSADAHAMTFLTPLFLLGLAALAIPVLIHLTQRERTAVVEFPSLMFLRKIPYESVKRRRIRDWLLLALRRGGAGADRGGVRAAVHARLGARPRPAAARARWWCCSIAPTAWVRRHAGRGPSRRRAPRSASAGALDRVVAGAVLVHRRARAAIERRRVAGRRRDRSARRPSAGATRYAPALKLASSLLAESSLPRKETILISDFQRAGWQPDEAFRLPAGSVFTPVAVEPPSQANLSITPLSLQRVASENQERVAVTAGVSNRGAEAASNVKVDLEVDGRVVQSATVNVAAGSSASTTFAPVRVHRRRDARRRTRIPADGLAASTTCSTRSSRRRRCCR